MTAGPAIRALLLRLQDSEKSRVAVVILFDKYVAADVDASFYDFRGTVKIVAMNRHSTRQAKITIQQNTQIQTVILEKQK